MRLRKRHNGGVGSMARWGRPVGEATLGLGLLSAVLAPTLGASHITVASLLYLLATLVVAARWGYAVGFGMAVAANLAVNFFFVRPLHRFTVASTDNVAALAVFLGVAAIGAWMLSRAREQTARALAHQADTEALLRATRAVADAPKPRAALNHLCEASARAVGARGCSLLTGEEMAVTGATIDDEANAPPDRDQVAAAFEALRVMDIIRLGGGRARAERAFYPLEAAGPAVLRFLGGVDAEALRTSLFLGLANEFRATLRRASLDAAAERARDLEKSGDFKSLLLTSVSHDLRTPLTAIKAAISSLRDDSVAWTDADRRAFLETIESQTDRLTKTVTNLLEMSRLEGGGDQPRAELIEVGALLAEVALLTAGRTAEREVSYGAPEGLWVRADYGLLVQALANLVENAAKYSTAGSPISLTGSGTPGRVFLTVANPGPPIDPQDLPRVFDRAYRGAGTGVQTGAGLGLALVKAIAEASGGAVSVKSDEGQTAFTMSLPMAKAPA